MGRFAVLDTETNWSDEVMSIGIVIAEDSTMEGMDSRYYVLFPECEVGGMYSSVVKLVPAPSTHIVSRAQAMCEIKEWLLAQNVTKLFAYNACFDRNHLQELSSFHWYDIMRVAAYRQHNVHIPSNVPCCKTGRLKRNYGVEPMLRMLSGDFDYVETHNALYDAMDELTIMKLLGLSLSSYDCARL